MKSKLSLDAVAGILIAILTVLFGVVILLGTQAGVRVAVDLPKDRVVAPFQIIKIIFSEPVDFEMASSVISLDPVMDGYLEWVDSRTMQLVPAKPFELDTVYTLTISPDILTGTGRELKKEKTWEFSVREPLVVYLNTGDNQSSLWTMDLNNNPAQRITPDGVKVSSFDTAHNGEFVVFSVMNEQGGIDLWRVSRAGNDASILLDCGRDRCTTPTISPNGVRIAYSREIAVPVSELSFGSPRIWVLDLQSRQNSPIYEDQQILGYGPAWSPDSKKLASYDGYSKQIRLLDLTNNQQYIFSSNTGGPVTWSSDSTKLLYTNVEQKEDGLRTRVHLADIPLNDSSILLGLNDEYDYAYYSLAWSPVRDMVVVGFRAGNDKPAEVFWLLNPGILEGIVIADEPDYTYNSPLWDPWGEALIFQQFKLHGALKPEIGLWKSGFSDPIILAQGIMPHWLP